jgi:DNA polymerase (family X)
VQNARVVYIFTQMADLLEIAGANPYRVRAYRTAARTIADLQTPVDQLARSDDALLKLPGIGKELAGKIREIVETGGLERLRSLQKNTGPELAHLMRLPQLGPKRIRTLHQHLGIQDLTALQAAAQAGRLRGLPGFGSRTEQAIRQALARGEVNRMLLPRAEQIAAALIGHMRQFAGIRQIEAAGSLRRRTETVRDLDLVAAGDDPFTLVAHFIAFEENARVIAREPTRAAIQLSTSCKVALRVVPEERFGAALHDVTGALRHTTAVRRRALQQGLKLHEEGLFEGATLVAGGTEAEIFARLGLAYIPPELREGRGELEAAASGTLPDLITRAAIRGDLHAHTTLTDGRADLPAMAQAAQAMGYEYLAITEHSQKLAMVGGLKPDQVLRNLDHIDRVNESLDTLVLLKGMEVDILEDGRLDLPDDVLARLDLRICAVHYGQRLSRERQTERILRAMDNRYFNILAHPTGRLIERRDPYEVDMARIMAAALSRGCYLELNANPDRLDLNARHCRMAREMGVKIAISTDAHSVMELNNMRFGIDQARRGWLTPEDVLNTRSRTELLKLMQPK